MKRQGNENILKCENDGEQDRQKKGKDAENEKSRRNK